MNPDPMSMQDSPDGSRQIPASTSILAWGLLSTAILFSLTLAALPLVKSLFLGPLPMVYTQVPPIKLETQDGQPFSHKDLQADKFHVMDFVFTRCGGQCPKMTASMAEFQKHLIANGWDDVRLLSVTVDPDNDTTEALREYGERFNADFRRWAFLRGPAETVYPWANRGLSLATEPNPGGSETGGEEFVHSNKFILIDRRGQVRGYYTGTDPEEVERLKVELGRLRLAGSGA